MRRRSAKVDSNRGVETAFRENRIKAAKLKYIVRKEPAATGREARCDVGARSSNKSNKSYEDNIRGISFLLFLTIDSRFTAPASVKFL